MSDSGIVAVVGAGPKGISIGVKAKVLREFGLPVDRVVLIEKRSVAANWTGEFGYTNGEMKLGTSPEKDVVFPIETKVGDPELNARVRQRLLEFSWTSFLVQTERFSDWVDRGRPAPCHQLWALYLQWVSERLAPEVTLLKAEVTRVDLDPAKSRWVLSLRTEPGVSGAQTLSADRLVLTGPGKTRSDFSLDASAISHPGWFDLESIWKTLRSGSFEPKSRVAIIGAGENAASILLALGERFPGRKYEVISPRGLISSRAENFYENQVYSQPERNGWRDLDPADRRDFIERTDLGVFSVHAMRILNEQAHHRTTPGRVVALAAEGDALRLTLEYSGRRSLREFDQVILATGFDQIALIKSIFSSDALDALERALAAPVCANEVASRIRSDLSIEGLAPALHLPMLAGLNQGPGFANLSCLGLLSDRIILGPQRAEAGR